MNAKLTISEIEYIYNLAEHKTDEELAKIIKKPVAIVQMLFSLMAGLPKRPWEKVVLPDIPPAPTVDEQTVTTRKKPKALKPLIVGKKRRKIPVKNKTVKKEKPVKTKEEKKPLSAHAQALERQKIRSARNNQSIYATRPIDLNGKIPYKLNHKTVVYEAPGANIEMLRKKYHIA